MDWSGVRDKLLVSVATALILGLLALVGNWASQGGLITILGGISKAEFDQKTKDLSAPGSLPQTAVVAFDSDVCPLGWTNFKPATGRTIIGSGTSLEPGMEEDENGSRLRPQKYRGHGGVRSVKLTERNIPIHQHETQLGTYDPLFGPTQPKARMISGTTAGTFPPALTSAFGQSSPDPLEVVSPYVALSYCKKA
jgi:hypothetical protein